MIAAAVNLLLGGSAIAIPVVIALGMTRALHPRLRYVIALVAFAAAALVPLVPRPAPPLPAAAVPLAESDVPSAVPAIVWAGVALLLLVREAAGHVTLIVRRARWRPADAALRAAVAWPADVPLFVAAGDGPSATGLWRPRVVLPEAWIAALPRETAACVARHELAHARWRDPLVNAAVRVVRAILWPSAPLWLLERVIRTEREAAADREAVGGASALDYASALVDAASRRSHVATALGGHAGLEERIARLVAVPRASFLRIAAAIAIVGAGAAVTSSVPRAVALSITPPPLAIPASASAPYRDAAGALNSILAATEYKNHIRDLGADVHFRRIARSGNVAPVADALAHPDRRVREAAAWAAGELRDPRLAPALANTLKHDPDRHTREAARWALTVSSRAKRGIPWHNDRKQ